MLVKQLLDRPGIKINPVDALFYAISNALFLELAIIYFNKSLILLLNIYHRLTCQAI